MKPTRSDALAAPVQSFTFHDATLDVARDNGDLWVSIRRVCEVLTIDHSSQMAKLRGRPWARVVMVTTHDTADRVQRAAMIHLDALPMWLATIEPGRVSADARPRLERFQVECARALRDHFFGRPGHADLPAHEVEIPNQPTAEEYEAKRDAMNRYAWKALAEAHDAQRQAWNFEDRVSHARMYAGVAKVLMEIEELGRELEPRHMDQSLDRVLETVLMELRSCRFSRSATRQLEAPKP